MGDRPVVRLADLIRMRKMKEEGVLPLEVKEEHDGEQEEVKAVIPTYGQESSDEAEEP